MASDAAIDTRPIERVAAEARPRRLGAYRLYERLGSGGQACVYRARRIGDPDAIDVAIKRLHPHLTFDAAAVDAFAREARLAYLLDHPVVRRVHALCREPGEVFQVMEYVEGVTLYTVLRRASASGRRLPLHGVLALLHRLCGALHYAHELVDERGAPAGFVHRDISPSNLIVTPGGRLKLIDLGVARALVTEHVTGAGLIKGKYGYMAPEVLWRAPFDRRADVYSVGVVAWELLTLHKLFPVRDPPVDLERVRARRIDRPSVHDPRCPDGLDAVVLRALAVDPAERWPSCAAMADALHDVAAGLGEPLADVDLVELVEAIADLDEVSAPARVAPRSRFARGTPARIPATFATADGPAPPAVAPPPRAPRRRGFLLGAAAGCLVTIVTAGIARHASRAAMELDDGPAVASEAPAEDAAAPADAAVPDAAPPDAAPPDGRPPDAAIEVVPSAPSADAAPRPPLTVDASAVTRLDGPWPRSRSTTARFRARLCIDADGAVRSVEVLAGPDRLHRRIARALRRWRYAPYLDGGEPRPVCFDVHARLHEHR